MKWIIVFCFVCLTSYAHDKLDGVVSGSLNAGVDSKYLTYGLVDNPDPIYTYGVDVNPIEPIWFNISTINDTTRYGRRAGYGNRRWQYQEIDTGTKGCYDFSPSDFDWIPTTIHVDLGYMYEYHHRYHGDVDDTQFLTLGISFPDLWIVPEIEIERDIIRDDGTYFNLNISRCHELTKELSIHMLVGQGLGNENRVYSYLSEEHCGLMDTMIMLKLEYKLFETCVVSTYVKYSEYLFDRRLRHADREYQGRNKHDESYNVICGFSIEIPF